MYMKIKASHLMIRNAFIIWMDMKVKSLHSTKTQMKMKLEVYTQ